jgi:hypothetical protein
VKYGLGYVWWQYGFIVTVLPVEISLFLLQLVVVSEYFPPPTIDVVSYESVRVL